MRATPARPSSRPRAAAPAAAAAIAAIAACAGAAPSGGTAPAPPAPAAPVPVAALATARTCADAAAGLERGTRGVRAPGTSVLDALRARCADDAWSADAIECFAAMDPDELARCAALLERPARDRLFDRLGDGASGPVGLALARARLGALSVGIPACDRFIDTVSRVLACDAMSPEVRAQLAAETADMWSLPVAGLPPDAQQRMIDVCSRSTAALEQHAADAGCAP